MTARTEPFAKPDEPVVAKKPEPPAPTSRAVRTEPPATPERSATPEPAPKPAPTPKADQAPVIRRPRIKAFEARAAEGATTSVAAEPVSRSTGKAPVAPASATKQDELQEEIRRLRDVAAPIAPVEKEGPTIADRITDSAKRKFDSAKAHRWLKSDIEDVAIKTGVVASAIGIFTLFALTIFILAGGFRGEPEFVPVPTTTIPPSPTTTVVVDHPASPTDHALPDRSCRAHRSLEHPRRAKPSGTGALHRPDLSLPGEPDSLHNIRRRAGSCSRFRGHPGDADRNPRR